MLSIGHLQATAAIRVPEYRDRPAYNDFTKRSSPSAPFSMLAMLQA